MTITEHKNLPACVGTDVVTIMVAFFCLFFGHCTGEREGGESEAHRLRPLRRVGATTITATRIFVAAVPLTELSTQRLPPRDFCGIKCEGGEE